MLVLHAWNLGLPVYISENSACPAAVNGQGTGHPQWVPPPRRHYQTRNSRVFLGKETLPYPDFL